MNILHDKSSVKSFSAKWIDRGYAREDVHSLRLQYVYTPEQREANRQICDAGPDEAHRRIKQAAESKNAVMASVMAAIAREFICYQYEAEDPAPYGSSRWELLQRLQQYASRLWIVWAGLLLFHTVLQLCPNSGTAGSSLRARPAVFRNPLSFKP